jgi:hypothetical protein
MNFQCISCPFFWCNTSPCILDNLFQCFPCTCTQYVFVCMTWQITAVAPRVSITLDWSLATEACGLSTWLSVTVTGWVVVINLYSTRSQVVRERSGEMPWLSTNCSTILRQLIASLGCVLLVIGRLRWTGNKWRSPQENIAVTEHVRSNVDIYSGNCVFVLVCVCVYLRERENERLDMKLLCISKRLWEL